MPKWPAKKIADTLGDSTLFSAVAPKLLRNLIADCPVRTVKPGQLIFSAGDKPVQFYLILSGNVKLYLISHRGDEQILHTYGPGDSFGEAAIWTSIPYPAHAEAQRETALLIITNDYLKTAIAKNPEFAFGMLAGLSKKLREFNKLIEQLSLQEVPERLAGVLLEMSERAGAKEFQLGQTKRELAARIGTVAETLSRAFRKLKQAGLIEVDGATIRILDRQGLVDLIQQ
jgi:CRP/FNR family transcriptional regulator, dissimilatory nitrate respiration regulator